MRKHIAPFAAFTLAALVASTGLTEDSPSLVYQACLTAADAGYARDITGCQGQRADRVQACRDRIATTRTRSKLSCERQFARANERLATRALEQQQRAQARAPR